MPSTTSSAGLKDINRLVNLSTALAGCGVYDGYWFGVRNGAFMVMDYKIIVSRVLCGKFISREIKSGRPNTVEIKF